jgi:hypothetical protein
MKITNNFNLPEQIVNACTFGQRPPKEKHISVTGLIGPAWKRKLEIEHWDELTEDVSSRLWALLGQSVHWFLEKHSVADAFAEERLYAHIGGWAVTGQSDSFNEKTKTVEDWKTTSVWTVVYKDRQDEWEQQLNCYAYLWKLNGFTVEKLQVNMILRDWVESKAREGGDYPPIPFITIDLPLWEASQTEAFILARLKVHENPAPCTDAERWHKADVFAVMKDGRKSAVKLFDDKEEAEKYMTGFTDQDKYHIDTRPGKDIRCNSYCSVSCHCIHRRIDDDKNNDA